MSNPTTPFNWQMPTPTDLVTDLPADFEVFGQAVATSMADLLGGTTGQILAKNSNTDMDFVWVANDQGDITAVTAGTGISGGGTSGAVTVTNSMATAIDAKGDLIAGTGADTFSRIAAGSNGETLVADSSTSTGLRYQGNFAAGKNKIISGDFSNWQRGTSFTMTNGVAAYTADRFSAYFTFASGSASVSRQTFTAGTAPVAGYEGQYFLRATKPAVNGYCIISQPIEDVRTFAGQTITVSFWAKINSGTLTSTMYVRQRFGSGGSGDVNQGFNYTVTTSWQRFTQTVNVASIAGKTIGAGSSLTIDPIFNLDSSGYDIDIWGLQVEAGSVATAFQTATGTIQGELSACMRYYEKTYDQGVNPATSTFTGIYWGAGSAASATTSYLNVPLRFAVTKRTAPSITFYDAVGNANQCTRSTLGVGDNNAQAITAGQIGMTGANAYSTGTSNTTFMFHYVASAEL